MPLEHMFRVKLSFLTFDYHLPDFSNWFHRNLEATILSSSSMTSTPVDSTYEWNHDVCLSWAFLTRWNVCPLTLTEKFCSLYGIITLPFVAILQVKASSDGRHMGWHKTRTFWRMLLIKVNIYLQYLLTGSLS